MGHAILSPSSGDRWLNCTPSARLEEYEPDTTSIYAREGTLAHNIAEINLRHFNKELTDGQKNYRINKLKKDDLFYPGMIDEIDDYLDYCIQEFNALDNAVMTVEQKLDISKYVPDGYGTGDCVLVNPSTIHIIDLKFGTGQVVDAFENTQLKLYALGAYDYWSFIYDEIEKVKITIAQVRLGEINSYEMDIKDLLNWGEKEVKPLAKKAYKGEGERNPGHWCKFCKVKTRCKKRTENLLEGIDKNKDPETLTNDEIAKLLYKAEDLKKWAKELENYALDEALKGEHFTGWKVVEGRSNRKITDENGFAKVLLDDGQKEDDIYKPKQLEGITKLTRLLGKKKFEEVSEGFIEKPEGKPTLVVESDKRPAINKAENEFDFN